MAGHNKLFPIVFLGMAAVLFSGCFGGWSDTSWDVPVAMRLVNDSVTADELFGSLKEELLELEDQQPIQLRLEEQPEPVDVGVEVTFIPFFAEESLEAETITASSVRPQNDEYVFSRTGISLAAMLEEQSDDYTIHWIDAAHIHLRLALKYDGSPVDPSEVEITVMLRREDDNIWSGTNVWDEEEAAIMTEETTIHSDSVLDVRVEKSGADFDAISHQSSTTMIYTIETETLEPRAIHADFELAEPISGLDPVQLDLGDADRLKQIFDAIDEIDVELTLTVLNDTGVDLDLASGVFDDGTAYEGLVLRFDDGQTLAAEDADVIDSGTEQTVLFGGDALWPILRELPETVSIEGEIGIGGRHQTVELIKKEPDDVWTIKGEVKTGFSLRLATSFTADFSEVEPFFTGAQEVDADPDFVDGLDGGTGIALYVEFDNDLPVGADLVLQTSTQDDAFDGGNYNETFVGTIPPHGTSDPLVLRVEEHIEDLIKSGGFIRGKLTVLGEGSMEVLSSDAISFRAWVEARIPVRFDNE